MAKGTKIEVKTDKIGNIVKYNFPEMVNGSSVKGIINRIKEDTNLSEKVKKEIIKEWENAEREIKESNLAYLDSRYKLKIIK